MSLCLCADGRSLHTDLDLTPFDEFLASHPEYHGLDGHDLMLKRLEYETDQRIKLEAQRKELMLRKTTTQAESRNRKNDLDNLTETLKKFIEVTSRDAS
jgi:Fms-interacting protein/Thoc5